MTAPATPSWTEDGSARPAVPDLHQPNERHHT